MVVGGSPPREGCKALFTRVACADRLLWLRLSSAPAEPPAQMGVLRAFEVGGAMVIVGTSAKAQTVKQSRKSRSRILPLCAGREWGG